MCQELEVRVSRLELLRKQQGWASHVWVPVAEDRGREEEGDDSREDRGSLATGGTGVFMASEIRAVREPGSVEPRDVK